MPLSSIYRDHSAAGWNIHIMMSLEILFMLANIEALQYLHCLSKYPGKGIQNVTLQFPVKVGKMSYTP